MITVSEVIEETIHREWWKFPRLNLLWRAINKDVQNFDSQVHNTFWIQEYRMTYTSSLHLVIFFRPYVDHEATNYRVVIEVGHAIAMVLNKFRFSKRHFANNYCIGQSTFGIYFYCYRDFG